MSAPTIDNVKTKSTLIIDQSKAVNVRMRNLIMIRQVNHGCLVN